MNNNCSFMKNNWLLLKSPEQKASNICLTKSSYSWKQMNINHRKLGKQHNVRDEIYTVLKINHSIVDLKWSQQTLFSLLYTNMMSWEEINAVFCSCIVAFTCSTLSDLLKTIIPDVQVVVRVDSWKTVGKIC